MNQFNLKPKSLCIAVILPAYNEELTIESTIEAFNKELPNAFIWVVNNLSTDANVEAFHPAGHLSTSSTSTMPSLLGSASIVGWQNTRCLQLSL